MRTGDKTAVGIDISQDRISIVLLKQGSNGIDLVKAAVAAMPDGAVKDGNIAEPDLLSKAIRELKHRSGIRAKRAAVSLFARPAVVQIIDMPRQVPSNIRQFVNSEIKNCVVLPGRDITVDFCGIGSARRTADRKVLAVAAESAKMVELVQTCGRAGFMVELIEPDLLAYLRAVYGQKITGKTGFNVLVAILQTTTLTLCVMRNGIVDFVRTKDLAKVTDSPEDLGHRLADELSEIIRFYDVEVPENTGKWDVTVFADGTQATVAQEHIKSRIKAERLQVRTIEDAYLDTPVAGSAEKTNEKPSPVAVGLAINLLVRQGAVARTNSPDVLRINLLPPQITQAREAKKDVLVTANAVAVVGVIMLLAINVFALLIARATRGAMAKEKLVEKQDTSALIEQQKFLDGRLGFLTARLDNIEKIRASRPDIDWVKIFNEIGKSVPGSIRITAIVCQDSSRMLIQGLALSNEAVYSFINLLEKSPSIASVTLLETREQNSRNGLVTYQLSCKLGTGSDKEENVG